MSTIRVLIVEDEPLIAQDICDCLQSRDYDVIDVVHDFSETLESLKTNPPDIAILDINLDGRMEGLDIGKIITEKYSFPFIYLTSYANKSIIEKAKPTRPMGYIVKPFNEKDLFSTIEIALYNYNIDRRPFALSLSSLNQKTLNQITSKEFEVLELIFKGMTNKQISKELCVSLNTTKTHVKNLYQKLDAHSRTELIQHVQERLKL